MFSVIDFQWNFADQWCMYGNLRWNGRYRKAYYEENSRDLSFIWTGILVWKVPFHQAKKWEQNADFVTFCWKVSLHQKLLHALCLSKQALTLLYKCLSSLYHGKYVIFMPNLISSYSMQFVFFAIRFSSLDQKCWKIPTPCVQKVLYFTFIKQAHTFIGDSWNYNELKKRFSNLLA